MGFFSNARKNLGEKIKDEYRFKQQLKSVEKTAVRKEMLRLANAKGTTKAREKIEKKAEKKREPLTFF